MPGFLMPYGYGEAEFTEKRSRFIGRVWPCDSEKEALKNIDEMRSKYWDAAHNVYAYSIRESGITRFSDDGEPQGTAGMPVLDVFRNNGIRDFLCVVTRYFGGILLGTGGLVRAYSHAAKLALDAAGIAAMKPVKLMKFTCPYHLFERVKAEVRLCGGVDENMEYGAEIDISVYIPEQNVDIFNERLSEISSGLIKPVSHESRYLPVKAD
jgi:uncharacterized YigZ family protein